MPKEFNQNWRVRQNYFSAYGDRRNGQLFTFHEVVSEYAKSILAHLENMSKGKIPTWRICRILSIL
jgi:hypothetical protein